MRTGTKAVGLLLGVGLAALQLAATALANPKPWMLSFNGAAVFTDNRDGTRNEKEKNLDLVATPRFDFKFDNQRTSLGFYLYPQVKWHSNPRKESEGDPQHDAEVFGAAGVDFAHRVSERFWLKAGDAFDYTDDPSISLGGAGERGSASYVGNSAYANMGAGFTRKLWMELAGRYSLKRYTDSAVANDENEDVGEEEANLAYKMGSGFSVFGLFRASEFRNASTERDRGSTILTGGAGVEKQFAPDVKGRVEVGGETAGYDQSGLDRKSTFYGQLGTVLGLAPLRLHADLLYGYYAPYVRPYSLQRLASAALTLEYDILPERLTGSLKGQYGMSQYFNETGTGSIDLPGGWDKLADVGLGITYKISRNFSCNAGYDFQNWDSDVRESFSQNTLSVAFTAQM